MGTISPVPHSPLHFYTKQIACSVAAIKHANSDTLGQLAPWLAQVRQRLPRLQEQGAGRFYTKSAALFHFHDDSTGLVADLAGGDWQRSPVNGDADYAALLQTLDQQLSDNAGPE